MIYTSVQLYMSTGSTCIIIIVIIIIMKFLDQQML